MYIENSVIIKEDVDKIFEIAQNVERHSEFMPEEIESYTKNNDGSVILQKNTKVFGRKFRWKSIGTIKKNQLIKFEIIEGVLKGKKTNWIFEKVPEGTKIVITHEFNIEIPLIGILIERLVYNFIIKKIATTTLKNLKERIEDKK